MRRRDERGVIHDKVMAAYDFTGLVCADGEDSENYRVARERLFNALDGGTVLNLSSLNLTSIPESFGRCAKLKELNLSRNELESIPESIGNCVNIEELYLSNDKLKSIPESIGNCANLVTVNLSHNELESIPESIGNCIALKELYLYNNPLKKDSLRTIPELQEMWASRPVTKSARKR